MSLWLFNLFMDAVMTGVREKAGDVGVTLWDERRNIEWKVDWLMFADNTVLLGDGEKTLERLYPKHSKLAEASSLKTI